MYVSSSLLRYLCWCWNSSVCAPGRAARSCGRIPGSAGSPWRRRPRPRRCCPARWRRGRGLPELTPCFFPNVEIAGDGELRDSLYLLFSEQLYAQRLKRRSARWSCAYFWESLGNSTRPHLQPDWEETNAIIHVGESQVLGLEPPGTANFWCGWKRWLAAPSLLSLRRIQKPPGRAVSPEENFGLFGWWLSKLVVIWRTASSSVWLLIVNSHW